MKDWTDERLATLLADAMAAHEGDVDTDRAWQLAGAAEPARRRWPAAVATAVAVGAVALGVSVYVAGRISDHAVPSLVGPTTPSGAATTAGADTDLRTTQENYQRAVEASEAALAALPVPNGAVRLDGEPSGWPEGGMSLGPSDPSLTRTAWWSTPMSEAEVRAFLTVHAPAGMRHSADEDVIVAGNSDGIAWTTYDVVTPADPAAYTGPSLLVQFTQLGAHTVLRGDTFLAARYAVPEEHRITDEVIAVQIDRVRPAEPHGEGKGGPLPTVRLTAPRDAAQITRLVDDFNSLYGSATHARLLSCPFPGNPRRKDTVTFLTATTSTVVAELEPACWGQIHVTIDGEPLKITLDPGAWAQLVNEIADATN